jgi:acyl-coenzyme A thioesterase PaaI-like protein
MVGSLECDSRSGVWCIVVQTTPPADAYVPLRSENAPEPGSAIPTHYKSCFGCGIDHETGLHMVVTAGHDLTANGVFTVTQHHQGAPGLAHGGLLSAAIDEVLGSLNWLLGVPAVTGRLECDFRKPVPVGTTLFVSAQIDAVHGRKVYTSAQARMNSIDGPTAVSAKAIFIQVDVQHFLDNGNSAEVKAAFQDRNGDWSKMAPNSDGVVQTLEVNP